MANGTVNPRSDQLAMSIDTIPGLRNELNDLRSMCTSSLQTTLSAFLNSYANTLHDDLASRAELDEVKTQLNKIIEVVETWDTENEDSTLEQLIKDVSDLQLKIGDLPALLLGLSESNLSAAKAVDSMTADLKEFREKLDTLTSDVETAAANIAAAEDRLVEVEAAVIPLAATSDEHSKLLAQLDASMTKIKQATDTFPSELAISKKASEVVEEPEGTPDAQENITENFNPEGYLDYQLTFKNKDNEELTKLSQPLALTEDINNYLEYSFYRFRRDYLDTTLALSDSRLSEIASCLTNLTQFVACLASHHNFVIKDIYLYFADGTDGIGLLPSAEKELVLINTNFPDYARIDNKTLTPVEVLNRKFYVIFKTSYPIDLRDNKVSLTFPDLIESDKTKYAPAEFRCTRIGIPDITNAFYVLHNTAGDSNSNLIPFTFGGAGTSVFGNLFTQRGTYNFALNVTDPYNDNVTATKSKQVTIGYPIYYGVHEADKLTTDFAELIKSDFTLLHTELNSPATTLDWSIQNKDRTQAVYYYYVVPKALLENKILNFNTGYGPGGWGVQDTSIVIDSLEYMVFHTAHALTYCPTTMVTVSNIQTIN